ncbi:MAG: histidine kinase, partial [Bacteroidota bacterium]
MLFTTVSLSQAQYPSFKEIHTGNGLAQNQVTSFFQDSNGYVWLGTKAGLTRYDGIKCTNFFEKDGLACDFVTSITETSGGNIVAICKKGISVFDGESFTPYLFEGNSQFYRWKNTQFITHALNDDWVFTIASGENIVFKNGEYYPADTLFPGIGKYHINYFWFGKDNESFLFQNKSGLYLYHNEKIIDFKSIDPDQFASVMLACDQSFVSQIGDSLYFFDQNSLVPDTVIRNPFYEKENWSIDFIDDDKIVYMIESPNILHLGDLESGKVIQGYSFNFPRIWSVESDREKNIWIIGERGANLILNHAILNFPKGNNGPYYIWDLVQDMEDNIWVSSFTTGLWQFDGEGFIPQKIKGLNTKNKKRKNLIFYMGSFRDKEGNVWLPTSKGVVKVENGIPQYQPQIPSGQILYGYQNPYNDYIFFGMMNELVVLKPDDSVTSHKIFPGEKQGAILSLTSDKYGNTWVANSSGISVWNGQGFTHLPQDSLQFDKGAFSMVTDHKGNIWIGNSKGLFLYDYSGDIRKIESDFTNHYVTDLQVVDSTGLFIGMIGGMAYLDLQSFYNDNHTHIEFFDSSNGFLGMEVLQNGSTVLNDGTILISASDRIIRFDPKKIKLNTISNPKIILRDIFILGEDMKWHPANLRKLPHNQKIVFKHNENFLQFHFEAVTMTHAEKVLYRYKIEGFEDQWSEPIRERFVNVTLLPPGDYTFWIDAANANGEWSENPVKFEFSVLQPWWHKSVVVMIGVVLLVLLIVLVVMFIYDRVKQQKFKKLQVEKRIAELKLGALKSQIDPHFVFNVMNSLGSSIFKGNSMEAYATLTRFAHLVRQAIENNESSFSTIEFEIDFVKSYLDLQKQRFKNVFDYTISIDNKVDTRTFVPRLLIQNLVENAVKHGVAPLKENGRVEISINKLPDSTLLVVEDNGIGRKASLEQQNGSTGIGLSVNRELISIFNQSNVK